MVVYLQYEFLLRLAALIIIKHTSTSPSHDCNTTSPQIPEHQFRLNRKPWTSPSQDCKAASPHHHQAHKPYCKAVMPSQTSTNSGPKTFCLM